MGFYLVIISRVLLCFTFLPISKSLRILNNVDAKLYQNNRKNLNNSKKTSTVILNLSEPVSTLFTQL